MKHLPSMQNARVLRYSRRASVPQLWGAIEPGLGMCLIVSECKGVSIRRRRPCTTVTRKEFEGKDKVTTLSAIIVTA